MTGPRPILLATRTRKARWPGRCVLCGAPITTGQRIGLLLRGWSHVQCIVQANRDVPAPGRAAPKEAP